MKKQLPRTALEKEALLWAGTKKIPDRYDIKVCRK
jgi:hypothetical protein